MQDVKTMLYKEISDFLRCFIEENHGELESRYAIGQELLEEMNEIIAETCSKADLGLFPLAQVQGRSCGKDYLDVDISNDGRFYVVECDLWVKNQPSDLVLILFYHLGDFHPKFEFRYFRD